MGRAYPGQVLGLFGHLADDPDGIDAVAGKLMTGAKSFIAVGESVSSAVGAAQARVDGDLVDPVGNLSLPIEKDTDELRAASTRAAAAMRIWASAVRSFNTKVDEFNKEYETAVGDNFGLQKPDDGNNDAARTWDGDLDRARWALIAKLKKEYASQEAILDTLANYAASVLEGDASILATPMAILDGLVEWLQEHPEILDWIGDVLDAIVTIFVLIGLAVALLGAIIGVSAALAAVAEFLLAFITVISVGALIFHLLAVIFGDKDALKDVVLDIIGLIPLLGKIPKIARYLGKLGKYLDDIFRYFDDVIEDSKEFFRTVYDFFKFGLQDTIESIVCWILGLFGHDCHPYPQEA